MSSPFWCQTLQVMSQEQQSILTVAVLQLYRSRIAGPSAEADGLFLWNLSAVSCHSAGAEYLAGGTHHRYFLNVLINSC